MAGSGRRSFLMTFQAVPQLTFHIRLFLGQRRKQLLSLVFSGRLTCKLAVDVNVALRDKSVHSYPPNACLIGTTNRNSLASNFNSILGAEDELRVTVPQVEYLVYLIQQRTPS
jgi:hypothetical protein